MLELEFWGAAGEVTGSCFLIKVGKARLLVDCGLIQGQAADEARNHDPLPFDPTEINAVVLTHAHLDHCGRLPLLVKTGYRGPIYTHKGTLDLCSIMLRDAAHIHEMEAERHNYRRHGRKKRSRPPLYTMHDAEAALQQFSTLPYDSKRDILPGIAVRLRDAGHILGASIVELWLQHDGVKRKLVFSGDLGHKGAPVMRDPTTIKNADLVIMESTYGDRSHPPWQASWDEVAEILQQAEWDHGNVLIPSFAVGRTQDTLYAFARNYTEWKIDCWEVFLDSPLAIEATEIYSRHLDCYDKEAKRFWGESESPFMLPRLNISRYAEESMEINRIHSGAIMIAGSGMCDGGRIRHHLKHNVWRDNCHIIMVGFQVEGTLGRALVDGARTINLWGEEVEVNATIHTLGGFSAHADREGLQQWYRAFNAHPPLALIHGEESARQALADSLCEEAVELYTPGYGDSLDLLQL
ncbi:MAG: MBL fold metallo-hydrolase [Pseudomonadota bacterium]